MASPNTTSNFRTASKPDMEHWKTVPYVGFSGIEVSDFGKVRNRKTNTIYTPYKLPQGNTGKTQCYVTISPDKASGRRRRAVSVAKLVYETWHNTTLPHGTYPEHINGDWKDNRLVNLELPKAKGVSTQPNIKISKLAEIRAANAASLQQSNIERRVTFEEAMEVFFGKQSPVEQKSAVPATEFQQSVAQSNPDEKYIRRYMERIEHLRVAISCCADWKTIEDVERLGILESEWLWTLEDMPVEDVAKLVVKLVEIAIKEQFK